MTEHVSTDDKRRARERAEARKELEEQNRQELRDRGISSNSFFGATSSTKTGTENLHPKVINGQDVQGKPEPARDLKPPTNQKFPCYLAPDEEPLRGNQTTSHRPVPCNRKGWAYSHNAPPRGAQEDFDLNQVTESQKRMLTQRSRKAKK